MKNWFQNNLLFEFYLYRYATAASGGLHRAAALGGGGGGEAVAAQQAGARAGAGALYKLNAADP